MARRDGPRLLEERAIEDGVISGRPLPPRTDGKRAGRGRAQPGGPVRSVTVNLGESPLGWLLARGHVSLRQYEAGERLRADWERSCLDPRVTMSWDGAPVARVGGASAGIDLSLAQIDARRRFHTATEAAGAGLSDILWRVVCAGEGMREAERALGWPVRAGKLVLTLALDRVADHYRMPLPSDRPAPVGQATA